jgi:hypothetical protein
VPNLRALERAPESWVTHIAIFTAATGILSLQKNIGMTIQESLDEFESVIQAGESRSWARKLKGCGGYVSTDIGCSF